MECPICFKIINNSVITNCVHHFCKDCLLKWVKKKHDTCPKCRSFIFFIKNDEEFNSINNLHNSKQNSPIPTLYNKSNSISSNSLFFDNISLYTLPLSKKNYTKIGISISNTNNQQIIITKIKNNSIASLAGLKQGHILLSINDIPIISQSQLIKIINFNKIISQDIILQIYFDNSLSPFQRICSSLNNLF